MGGWMLWLHVCVKEQVNQWEVAKTERAPGEKGPSNVLHLLWDFQMSFKEEVILLWSKQRKRH